MSTIKAILQPQPDGTLHVPVPKELRHSKFKVVATSASGETEACSIPNSGEGGGGEDEAERKRQRELLEITERLIALRPFSGIDPLEWQREIREDREMPFDEAPKSK